MRSFCFSNRTKKKNMANINAKKERRKALKSMLSFGALLFFTGCDDDGDKELNEALSKHEELLDKLEKIVTTKLSKDNAIDLAAKFKVADLDDNQEITKSAKNRIDALAAKNISPSKKQSSRYDKLMEKEKIIIDISYEFYMSLRKMGTL